ncbi:MAG: hypothetical protein OEZ22_02835 [Spirochaetia bacterium]|nr:hypothetical protein [Spirochaetia bacterium]
MNSNKKIIRREYPRVKNFHLENIKFVNSQNNDSLNIINLSNTGIALLQGAYPIEIIENDLVSGNLIIENEKIPVVLKLVRKNGNIFAFTFEKSKEEVSKLLKKIFDIELKALKMYGVKKDFLIKQPDGNPFWFFDGEKNELYYIENNSQMIRYRICLSNYIIQKNKNEKLEYYDSNYESKLNKVIIEKFIRFVYNIDGLKKEYFNLIKEDLESML